MIIYCLLSKDGKVVGEYGITSHDYSSDLLDVMVDNRRMGTMFMSLGSLNCAILNKCYAGENYSLAVVVEQVTERDASFDCLDRIANDFEKDMKVKKIKACVARIGKHMRAAMVG